MENYFKGLHRLKQQGPIDRRDLQVGVEILLEPLGPQNHRGAIQRVV